MCNAIMDFLTMDVGPPTLYGGGTPSTMMSMNIGNNIPGNTGGNGFNQMPLSNIVPGGGGGIPNMIQTPNFMNPSGIPNTIGIRLPGGELPNSGAQGFGPGFGLGTGMEVNPWSGFPGSLQNPSVPMLPVLLETAAKIVNIPHLNAEGTAVRNQYDQKANQYDQKANQYDGKANRYDQKANQYDQKANRYDGKANRYDQKANQYDEKANTADLAGEPKSSAHVEPAMFVETKMTYAGRVAMAPPMGICPDGHMYCRKLLHDAISGRTEELKARMRKKERELNDNMILFGKLIQKSCATRFPSRYVHHCVAFAKKLKEITSLYLHDYSNAEICSDLNVGFCDNPTYLYVSESAMGKV
eukprot:g3450.t1